MLSAAATSLYRGLTLLPSPEDDRFDWTPAAPTSWKDIQHHLSIVSENGHPKFLYIWFFVTSRIRVKIHENIIHVAALWHRDLEMLDDMEVDPMISAAPEFLPDFPWDNLSETGTKCFKDTSYGTSCVFCVMAVGAPELKIRCILPVVLSVPTRLCYLCRNFAGLSWKNRISPSWIHLIHVAFFQTPDHLMTGRAKNKDNLRMFLSRHFFDGFDYLPHPKGFLGCGTHMAWRPKAASVQNECVWRSPTSPRWSNQRGRSMAAEYKEKPSMNSHWFLKRASKLPIHATSRSPFGVCPKWCTKKSSNFWRNTLKTIHWHWGALRHTHDIIRPAMPHTFHSTKVPLAHLKSQAVHAPLDNLHRTSFSHINSSGYGSGGAGDGGTPTDPTVNQPVSTCLIRSTQISW